MKRIFVMVALLSTALVGRSEPQRVLLAVFAHPDDEIAAGPALARYAREGANVYVAIAARGEKGAFPHAGIPAGDELAKIRREEAICSCQQLGIKPPEFFGM